jgi:AcrR family transcriptional regulator
MPTVRRRSTRGDARRRQILDGALAAIREQSIADVQLASIAAHAGLRPNHLLYYFPSRDAVLIAAVAYAEEQLAQGRSERLRAIADPRERLVAYVKAYLPEDRHDPVWKLWIEGWLRSASREEFAEVGWEANLGWRADLVEALQHAIGPSRQTTEETATLARRFSFLLDGTAVHVLAGHITASEAVELAMSALRSELPLDAQAQA